MPNVPLDARAVLKPLVQCLVDRRYEDLVAMGRPGRVDISGAALRAYMADIPNNFQDTPDTAWSTVSVYPVASGVWNVDVPLWSADGRQSDVTLRATVEEGPDGRFVATLTDVRIL